MALVLLVALLLGGLGILSRFRRRSSVKDIPGPPSTSWIYGNLLDLLLPHSYGDHEFEWQRRYGAVYRIKGCFGSDQLVVSDPLSLQYVLKGTAFRRSPMLDNLIDILHEEESTVALRGEDHQRARAALNPAFTAIAVREFLPVLERTAEMLTALLEDALVAKSPTDICPMVGTATLSAVSEAMFGCTLQDLGEELVANYRHLIVMAGSYSRAHIIGAVLIPYIPRTLLRLALRVPSRVSRVVLKAKTLNLQLGTRLVNERLDALQRGLELNKDIFSFLLDPRTAGKSRYAMTGRQVAAQTSLLLIAGQDTTANLLSFALRELAIHPDFQNKLRAEIHANSASHADGDAVYEHMPLLNAFIKEMLRMYPILPLSEQIATKDTFLPLTRPITTTSGERITEVPIQKGQIITLASGSYQRLESLWGSDADEWKPSRWIEGTMYKGDAVGPYSNLLSFFGGPRVCLGWRFALLEMQVLTCELVGKFSFALPEDHDVRPRFGATLMPTGPNGEKSCPLYVTRIL
ncbi:cytochrome P450 [Mycena rebaudengoi]|nr:cytochrome P450 [Mycena rebaudengoi]